MQPRPWPGVPALTAQVAGAAFPGGSLAIRVRDELGAWCPDEAFAGVYGVRGAPGISPAQLAVVKALQFAEGLTDRQAADAVRGRIDWKYCLGLELADAGFDFSVLSEFRGRLVAGSGERLLLDLLLARLKELGLVKAGGRAWTDSTQHGPLSSGAGFEPATSGSGARATEARTPGCLPCGPAGCHPVVLRFLSGHR